MTKWEHSWITLNLFKNTEAILDEYGEEGWELVTIFRDNDSFQAFFKRPKS